MSTSSVVAVVVVAETVLTRNQAFLSHFETAYFPSGCHCQIEKSRRPLP